MLVIDHVMTDNLCNLRCSYCPCDVTLLQRTGLQIRTRNGREGPPPENISDFLERTVSVIDRIDDYVDTPILKISGGELFLIPEFLELLPILCNRFEIVQILTNGTLLDDVTVARLSTFRQVHLQVSLDGHTYDMNRFRFTNPSSFTTALDGLLRSVRTQLPVEVNTVLTTANIEGFWNFVGFLHDHVSERLLVYPFPVRSNPGMVPSKDQVQAFCSKMPSAYANHEALLPPKAYMAALCEFLRYGRRKSGCSVPYAVVGSNGDGTLDACTCGPVKVLGSVLQGGGSAALGRIGRDDCYSEVLSLSRMPHCCDDCFTHYDIINLFVEGAITETEMAKLPFFGTPKILLALRAVKDATEAATISRMSTGFGGCETGPRD